MNTKADTRNPSTHESGIALPLAMIMVLLIGVMGAGLLTFVVTDLGTVVEVNQGQKSLEMAETGVKVAKIQLQEKPDIRNYDAAGDAWFDDPSTPTFEGKIVKMDSHEAKVSIKPAPNSTPAQPYYTVTSESSIGQTKRKVQAIFRAAGWGVKAYYTPGSIFISPDDSAVANDGDVTPPFTNNEYLGSQLQDRIDIRGVSFFAGRDVVISDNRSVVYRRTSSSETRTDSTTGGGLVANNEYYCIYEDATDPYFGRNYESYFRTNTSSRCQTHFFAGSGEYDTGSNGYGGSVSSDTARYPSSWERYNQSASNPVQPHVRIIANAECPEIEDQWNATIASPNVNADVLDSWNKAPFNEQARALDPTQIYTNPSQNATPTATAGPAPCQNLGSSQDLDLETYPSGAERYYPASIAAEGLICRASQAVSESYTDKYFVTNPDGTPVTNPDGTRRLETSPVTTGFGCQNTATSIANFRVGDVRGGAGRIGFDSSTTPRFYDKKDKGPAGTTAESPAPTGWTSDLSYPFDPDKGPDVPGLLQLSQDQGRYIDGVPTNSQWQSFYPPAGRNNRVVVFVDANGQDITLPQDLGSEETRGVLVVRCGNLTNMRAKFNGIILVLNDPGPSDNTASEKTNCQQKEGNYRSNKPRRGATGPTDVGGYVYAEGYGDNSSPDTDPRDGMPDFRYSITIADASDINRLPRGPGFADLTEIVGSGLEGVQLESWRECYNDTCSSP